MSEPSVRVDSKLQLLESGATPVPVVKDLMVIAKESGVPLGDLVDLDQLRALCIQALRHALQPFMEGRVVGTADGLNFGTFCARFRGQTMSLQRILGEHDDFADFTRLVEHVADKAFLR